ncbi:MAG: DUF3368 domain-containing protein [Planctomycetes bacterium]|nr:DUF3368 domain-containing protein [Planctomycetota bacterium]
MIVVSDASPLIVLDAIGQLTLLPELFGPVIVPSAVGEELARGRDRPIVPDDHVWMSVRSPRRPGGHGVRPALGTGEREAIELALELQADLLLIDEAPGRREAERLRLTFTGVLGILGIAKQAGRIPSVRELIERIQRETSFRLSPGVIEQALEEAGESSS